MPAAGRQRRGGALRLVQQRQSGGNKKTDGNTPSVISSGMIKCSKSMKVAAISPANTMLQQSRAKRLACFSSKNCPTSEKSKARQDFNTM